MDLVMIVLLLSASVYLLLYQFKAQLFGLDEAHLPLQMLSENVSDEEAVKALAQKDYPKFKQKRASVLAPILKGWESRLPFPATGLKKRLIKAGKPMETMEFIIFKVLSFILVPSVAFIFLGKSDSKEIIFIISLAVGFFLPELWLKKKISARQAKIRRDLPNIIDLLNLCVSGGLDFMLAVNRVVKDLRSCDLTRELGEVYRETQMGKSRREALKNFAERLDMPEVHSFVRTLVQADRMGTPMAEAMGMQAEEMRFRRFQNGEAMALKAPIKLLFPLFAFILPVVLVIVGGPIILNFTRGSLAMGF